MSITKLAWLTDIHLNFLDKQKRKLFYNEVLSKNCDTILIGGDIAEATCATRYLILSQEED